MKNKLLQASSTKNLGIAYAEAKIDKSMQELEMAVNNIASNPSSKIASIGEQEEMLLSQSSGPVIADYLQVPELAMEIQRAVWQVERSLQAKRELREEKQAIDTATKKPSQ